jgi:hypothetical protein
MERRARAVELRKTGATIAQVAAAIAKEFNDSNYGNSQAFKDIDVVSLQLFREQFSHHSETLRELELQRYDDLLLKLQPKLDKGEAQAVTAAVKISQQRCRLLGLEEPIMIKIKEGLEEELTALLNLLERKLPYDHYRKVLEAICESSLTASTEEFERLP